MFSLGIDPSITSTNGAPRVPSTASRYGFRNSSPPSDGASSLLCKCTLGRPGIAPSSTSSMLGSDAAVTDTESPSQLIPSEIQRMWTSSTPDAVALISASPPGKQFFLIELECVHEQLLSARHVNVERAARPA